MSRPSRPLHDSEVIYEDNHLLVLEKRPGVATMGAEGGEETMVELAADYLRKKYGKPGKVFIGVVSRIDRLVSGVLVFARTSKGASRLSQQFRERSPHKRYIAIVEGRMPDTEAEWTTLRDFMRKNEPQHRMEICENPDSGHLAELRYRVVSSSRSRSIAEVELLTGRKHQIRLQMSALGHPIVGDRKYGAKTPFVIKNASCIGLHCVQMTIDHPTRHEPVQLCSPLRKFWGEVINPADAALLGSDW